MARRILVTGASVAGNTAAWWLSRHGCDVTVVERAPDFLDGGQNVDVRGLGREVLRRMGLEKAALDHGTGELGTAWVGEGGKIAARFMLDGKGDGPTAEMEILRGDLARLLYEAAKDRATFRFGGGVTAIEQDDKSATVTFVGGRAESFDAVVVAEGVGSSTRDLVFPGENEPRMMIKLRRTERGHRLPFIMMTAQNQRRFMEVARDAGATHFLAKPFTAETLGAKIATIEAVVDDQLARA